MSSSVSAMLTNFRKRYLSCSPPQQERQSLLSWTESQADAPVTDYPDQMDDAVAQRHRATAMAETVDVAGCPCPFCSRHAEIDDDADPGCTPTMPRSQTHDHHSLPSTRSVVQVLYPPSYLGTPRPFPDPPSYSPSDSSPYPARGDDAETSPLISTTPTSIEETPLSPSCLDPLAQDPSLTGVPSQGALFSRTMPVEPSPPIIALGRDVSGETEPPPVYSRFDQRRPRFPAASDVLGPYPPLSALREAAP